MCHIVSVDYPRNLHSGVSEALSTLCLNEFVLKDSSCPASIKHSFSFFVRIMAKVISKNPPQLHLMVVG